MEYDKIEEFFLSSVDIGKLIKAFDKTEYIFLYNVKKMQVGDDRVYLTDLAERMEQPITEVSKVVRKLEEKGYVDWRPDEKKEHTYVTLTSKGENSIKKQKDKTKNIYKRVMAEIPEEELEQTLRTVGKIRSLLKENV